MELKSISSYEERYKYKGIIKTKISMQDSSGLGVYDSQVYLGEEMIAQATISVLNPNDTFLEKILES